MLRRTFIFCAGASAATALLPLLPAVAHATKIDFPRDVRWRLYMIHNRYSNAQLERLLVWTDGEKYDFTPSDERDHLLAADRAWKCLGRLRWVVGRDGYYEHHVEAVV